MSGWLGVAVSVGWAGMAQQSPVFSAKGQAVYEGPPPALGAPGPDGLSRPPGPTNLRLYTTGGQPSPVTREKTDVTLDLVAKYGDDKDQDLRRYEATFSGHYVVRNKKQEKVTVNVFFPYPSSADTIPGARVMVGGHEPDGAKYTHQGVQWESSFDPEEAKDIVIEYRAFGTEDFSYMLDRDERLGELSFKLAVTGTERRPELPARVCLEPSGPLTRTADGWHAEWVYTNLLTTRDIVIVIPPRLMGSNLALFSSRLVWAGLLTVILFGLVLFTGAVVARRPLGVGQFLLIVLALVTFYPVLLYMSQYLPVAAAFWISYLAVSGLVLANLRRGQGLSFALRYGGFALVVLLGLSTAAALATKGSGALVTVGWLLLVGYIMSVAPGVAAAIKAARPPLPPAPPPPAPRPSRPVAPQPGDAGAAEEPRPASAEASEPASP
ncbi:MAG TPA: hypothetical protein VGM19_01005 [Armatimonadota bacterium]